ncbi:MAG: zinc ABC transporter substrate-binding protein [Roseobacter sp.]
MATDIAPVHGLVAQVMEGVGVPDLVIPPGASPHGYAMRPSEARALADADIVFWVGPALTPWLQEPIETLASDAQTVSLAQVEGTIQLPFRTGARFDAHAHDHDHGHGGDADHAHAKAEEHAHDHDDGAEHTEDAHHRVPDVAFDSHLWLDPENASLWLGMIADVLAAQDPENAPLYRGNAKTAQAGLTTLAADISARTAPLQGKPFIVFHDAYRYYEARFGVEAVASVTLSDDSAASAARLATVREVIAETGAQCALAEPRANTGLIDAVSESAGIRIGTVDAVGFDLPLGPGYYAALMRQITDGLTECLSPNS